MTYPQQSWPQPTPPPAAEPAPPSRRRAWIVIGVVSVLVVTAGVGGTLYATGVIGSGDDSAAKPSESASNTSISIKELSSPSPDTEPPIYRFRHGACGDVDWEPLAELTGLDADEMEESYTPSPGSAKIHCVVDNADDDSSYNLELTIFDSTKAATEEYQALADGSGSSDGKTAEGPWDKGEWAYEGTDGSAYAFLYARDSNVFLSFNASDDDGDSVGDVKETVTAATEEMFAVLTVE